MVQWAIESLTLIEREHGVAADLPPGQPGDTVEINCVGGTVKEVDPKTKKSRASNQRFKIQSDGSTIKSVKIQRMDISAQWKKLRP